MVAVAQLAEHRVVVPGVVGSNPISHPTPNEVRTLDHRSWWPEVRTSFVFAGLALSCYSGQIEGDPPSMDVSLAVACGFALLAGAAAAAGAGADPAMPATQPVPEDAPRAADGRAWRRRVAASRRLRTWFMGLGTLFYAGGAVALGVAAGSWVFVVTMLAPLAVVALSLVWDVRVDRDGITATCVLGWPRHHVPASEVIRADVTQVDPFPEFGGWGLRLLPNGTVGVVVRAGEAIEVERTGGRRFVVTVDDALTGARLLNAAADRARSGACSDVPDSGAAESR